MSTGIAPYAALAKYYDGAYAVMKDLNSATDMIFLLQRKRWPSLSRPVAGLCVIS